MTQIQPNNSDFSEQTKPKKAGFTGGFWQFTPIGKISAQTLEKKLSKDPIRLFIPTIPLPAIEIKYLGIQFGRLIFSIFLSIILSLLISSNPVQNAFEAQVIDRYLPKLELPFANLKLNLDTNTNNFDKFFSNNINNFGANLKQIGEEINSSPKQIENYVKREFWRRFWYNFVVGGGIIGQILRGLFFYLLISILYKNNKTDWKSLEREIAKQKFDLAKLSESILGALAQNFDKIVATNQFSSEQIQILQNLIFDPNHNKKFTADQFELLIKALKNL
jgi:hypothetical protein